MAPTDQPTEERRWFPYHPLLLAIWPILFLYTQNLDEINSLSPVLNWALIVLAPAVVLMALLYGFLRDVHKSALWVTLAVLAFYGSAFIFRLLARPRVVKQYVVIAVIAVLLVLAAAWLRRSPRRFVIATRLLNVVALVAILQSLVPLAASWFAPREKVEAEAETGIGASLSGSRSPDIYYIILDAYGRDDVFADYYGFDNSEFGRELESRGFFVARESTSNYSQTRLSIPSALNLGYLEELDPNLEGLRLKGKRKRKKNREALDDWVAESKVFREFERLGYTFHLITSRFRGTSSSSHAGVVHPCHSISEFGVIVVQTSMLKAFRKALVRGRVQGQILCQYEALESVAEAEGPKFVFTHIVSPHSPWLFDANGNAVDLDQDLAMGAAVDETDRYVDQVRFNNKKLLEVIDAILSLPGSDPIVILQGDHGPDYAGDAKRNRQLKKRLGKAKDEHRRSMLRPGGAYAPAVRERMGILNAYRFPGAGSKSLYPSITPVNSFRLVFDTYFGTSLGLRPDKALFSLYEQPYRVWDVTWSVRKLSGLEPVAPGARSVATQTEPVEPDIR